MSMSGGLRGACTLFDARLEWCVGKIELYSSRQGVSAFPIFDLSAKFRVGNGKGIICFQEESESASNNMPHANCMIHKSGIISGRKEGFTLVELLVVIAIIAILAAMLLPTLTRAKEEGQGVQCMSNMRQMALGWRMYAQDNREFVVLASAGPAKDPYNPYAWTKQSEDFSDNAYNYDPSVDITVGPLYPYINSYMVYRCPADTSVIAHATNGGVVMMPRVRTVSMNFFWGGFGGFDASYGMGVGANSWGDLYPIYGKTTDLTPPQSLGPTETFVFIDERQDCVNVGNYMTDMAGDTPSEPALYEFNEDMPGMYHNRAAGFAFADGHALIQRWQDFRTTPPLTQPSTAVGAITGPAANGLFVPRDVDVRWLQLHTVRAFQP
jgi:prepilin-type N-terminal cleavage/methylation domain-containing protein/prepilin-type processing-associated H-X9-DG protein